MDVKLHPENSPRSTPPLPERAQTQTKIPLVTAQDSIRLTMEVIDRFAKGIAVVVDEHVRPLATVTDGDIRRAILAGIDLDQPVNQLQKSGHTTPITADIHTSDSELLSLMERYSIRQIPLTDKEGKVCGLAVLHELLRQSDLPVTGVIMAGGYGRRLSPLTLSVPKPMLPVNGRPLLEHTLSKLRQSGVRSINLATHHLSESIFEHFKDGSKFGVELQYFHETQPLGTAGGLAKMAAGTDPLLVINGDVLTNLDVRAMLDYHREHQALVTVGVRQYDIEVPFGVVETAGVRVICIKEKPVLRHFINAGIYMVDRRVCSLIPEGKKFDMTDLIAAVMQSGGSVVSFPIREYWIDIGLLDQYQKAERDVAMGTV